MIANEIATGVAHEVPEDLKQALASSTDLLAEWNDMTPLARNEWICWVVSVKQEKTRAHHIQRMQTELLTGKRRPCCWAGCVHRDRNGKA
jgi:uncharacterized protein YdeI (YjbR/CyaY-like superfamily)